MRIGFGTDIHRLVAGRRLVIGGVAIESDLGADGHSDADVLMHSAADAVLGAIAGGDLGAHFPTDEERWRNAESYQFLEHVVGLAREEGFIIGNFDSVVHLEKPKLRPYVDAMRTNLASALAVDISQVSIKAKTGEGVDAVGQGLAVSAQAVVLLLGR
jgi:2-C-methyl-D-erythritol 2,4-cyclodiphosphate synthase